MDVVAVVVDKLDVDCDRDGQDVGYIQANDRCLCSRGAGVDICVSGAYRRVCESLKRICMSLS